MPEENKGTTPSPLQALGVIDQALGKMSGTGIDRAWQVQMQQLVNIILEAIPRDEPMPVKSPAPPSVSHPRRKKS